MRLKTISPEMNVMAATLSIRNDAATSGPRALRILHVIDRLDLGGTEHGILKVTDGLCDGSFEHRFCTARGYNAEMVRRRNLEGKLFVAGSSRNRFQLLVFEFARIMKHYRPHIVHSRNWGSIEATFAARLARVPVVIHSEHGYEMDMLNGLPLRRRLLRQAAYALSDVVMTVSSELRDYHRKQVWFVRNGIRVLPNGVDTSRFAPRPGLGADLRKMFGVPPDGLVLGSVGRLVAIKDHLTLLKAAAVLADRGVRVNVVLAGDGPEAANLRSAAAALPQISGRVHFLGASQNIAEVLNALDIFVLPSTAEGMSNTLLEAMSSGLVVVATKVGGNPELVEEGYSGFLFNPGDVTKLAHLLEILAATPETRRKMGEAARKRVLERFCLEDMITAYKTMYLELAAKRGISVPRSA